MKAASKTAVVARTTPMVTTAPRSGWVMDLVSCTFSLVSVALFIWLPRPDGASIAPYHAGYEGAGTGSNIDASLSCGGAWWRRLRINAMTATVQGNNEPSPYHRRRRGIATTENVCLVVPPTATNAKRITPNNRYLVDHDGTAGVVSGPGACWGRGDLVADFSAAAATWAGCSRRIHPGWTGYVCRDVGGGVATRCPMFKEVEACDLGKDAPCPAHKDDTGCAAGLLPGETCTTSCSDGWGPTAAIRHRTACPLNNPMCRPLCPLDDIPRGMPWMPFKLAWNAEEQLARPVALGRGMVCNPKALACGASSLTVRCKAVTCPALMWAGVYSRVSYPKRLRPRCPVGQTTIVDYISCTADGTWSLTESTCRTIRKPIIATSTSPCINNSRTVTKTIVDRGMPPIASRLETPMTWNERCQSPPPTCCPDGGLGASTGHLVYGQPICKCSFKHLGYHNPTPCCTLQHAAPEPKLVFHEKITAPMRITACPGGAPCSSKACLNNQLGCFAFNKTHTARQGVDKGTIYAAFTWDV